MKVNEIVVCFYLRIMFSANIYHHILRMEKSLCIICFCVFLFLFGGCKTIQLHSIEKQFDKTTEKIYFPNQKIFEKSREKMFRSLPPDILKNDTIIILEYFTDGTELPYYYSLYLSGNKSTNRFEVYRKQRFGSKFYVKRCPFDLDKEIMRMAIDNRLDEIEKRGMDVGYRSRTSLIVNVCVKNKNKKSFHVKSIITQKFGTLNYPFNNSSLESNENILSVMKDSAIASIPYNTYRIKRIIEEKEFYIIFACRDNQIYKIVSVKDTHDCPKEQRIRRNKEYKLALESQFVAFDDEGRKHRVVGVGGLFFYGKTVYIEEKAGYIRDLFWATNLKGLCITEEK